MNDERTEKAKEYYFKEKEEAKKIVGLHCMIIVITKW